MNPFVMFLFTIILAVWVKSGVDLALVGENGLAALICSFIVCQAGLAWMAFKRGRSIAVAQATATATAIADAKADASAHAQQAVIVNIQGDVSRGARATARREYGGLDRAEWLDGPKPLIEQDAIDDVDQDVLEELQTQVIESS